MDDSDADVFRIPHGVKPLCLAINTQLSIVSAVWMHSTENLNQCRFARAVFATECVALPGSHLKRDIVQGAHAGKIFGDGLHLEKRRCHFDYRTAPTGGIVQAGPPT